MKDKSWKAALNHSFILSFLHYKPYHFYYLASPFFFHIQNQSKWSICVCRSPTSCQLHGVLPNVREWDRPNRYQFESPADGGRELPQHMKMLSPAFGCRSCPTWIWIIWKCKGVMDCLPFAWPAIAIELKGMPHSREQFEWLNLGKENCFCFSFDMQYSSCYPRRWQLELSYWYVIYSALINRVAPF